jgi:hypothetical protein
VCLTDEQIEEAFEYFSGYFTRAGHDSFFDLWIKLLDGIELVHQPQTFAGGGICCVDLIKCPTADSWGGVVRGPDKGLIYGCFLNDGSQRYLKRQIEIHRPQVLIFSAGLCGPRYYSNNCSANRDVGLRKLWSKGIKDICCGVWSFEFFDQLLEKETSAEAQRCLSIGLGSDDKVRLNPNETKKAIQDVIWSWEGFAGDTNGVL